MSTNIIHTAKSIDRQNTLCYVQKLTPTGIFYSNISFFFYVRAINYFLIEMTIVRENNLQRNYYVLFTNRKRKRMRENEKEKKTEKKHKQICVHMNLWMTHLIICYITHINSPTRPQASASVYSCFFLHSATMYSRSKNTTMFDLEKSLGIKITKTK